MPRTGLSQKQRRALEMLTSGSGYDYTEICREIGVTDKTLWSWRNGSNPTDILFQNELKKLNEMRWQAAEDAARESCITLCKEGNQKMIEFVLKNVGYNPAQKVEAEISTDINITIEE